MVKLSDNTRQEVANHCCYGCKYNYDEWCEAYHIIKNNPHYEPTCMLTDKEKYDS